MIRHYTLTLTTGAQRLSSVLGDYNASGAQNPSDDRSWRQLALQADAANTGAITVGGYGTLLTTTGAHGFLIPAPTSSVPAAPFIFTDTRLDEVVVLGVASEKLHILAKA